MPEPAERVVVLTVDFERSRSEVLRGLRALERTVRVRAHRLPSLSFVDDEEWFEFHYALGPLSLWRLRLDFEQAGLRCRGRVGLWPRRPRLGVGMLRILLARLVRAMVLTDPESVVRRGVACGVGREAVGRGVDRPATEAMRQSTPRMGGSWKVEPKTRSEAPTRSR